MIYEEMHGWVLVSTPLQQGKAETIRIHLEGAGIPVRILREDIFVGAQPLYANVLIYVPKQYKSEAESLIEGDNSSITDEELTRAALEATVPVEKSIERSPVSSETLFFFVLVAGICGVFLYGFLK